MRTPGEIMNQTQATLRHRGVTMDEAAFEAVDEYIIGGGQVSALDADGEPGNLWVQSTFVVTFIQATGVAMVTAPGFDLDYTFEVF